MSKEILVVLNSKRGSVKAQQTRIKDFINNPDERDKIKLESKMDTLKSLRIKLSDIREEYYEPKQTVPYVESFDNEGEELVGHVKGHSTGVLSTAIVYCQNNRGELFPIRTLLDNESMCNLILQDAALFLGLQSERVNTSICGINRTSQIIKNRVFAVISNKNRQFQKLMEYLVVPKITGLTPTNKLDISGIKIPEYIKLSDENFYSPGRIDLLLSNQIFFEILNHGKIKLAEGYSIRLRS
ncbi:integrase catalytic domain-containing protein [Trichonephila clavata]|uniref:Integrase catalytic domain-containing protein n=1 Tax=Trichonephila clavata TaxID=2740835 RepID=A0A8X6KQW8_TRICU|nr:integrase catalytic domain-containing protein [Trichonephila clavata]